MSRKARLKNWWWRGVDTAPVAPDLSPALNSHLRSIASHAEEIERAAAHDGLKIRRGAILSAMRVVDYVENLEDELTKVETEFGSLLQAMRAEIAALRGDLEREAEQAEAIAVETNRKDAVAAAAAAANGETTNGQVPNGYVPTVPNGQVPNGQVATPSEAAAGISSAAA